MADLKWAVTSRVIASATWIIPGIAKGYTPFWTRVKHQVIKQMSLQETKSEHV